jgi:SAM-dependent methyltransferase
MTRLDRLLLHIPRLRNLVLDREAFAAHATRLQRELNESLAREKALRGELAEAEKHAVMHSAAQSVSARMREDWDARARTEGRYFIATGRETWTDDEFFASGEENVRQHILTDMENICGGMEPRTMRVLEIGCGAGRLTKALAAIFGEVHGVDVSPEMIRLGREKLSGVGNVRLHVNNGVDLSVVPDVPFDFAFSFIVFQHVPEKEIIESYVREVQRVLRPGSLFKFQVEGGPAANGPADTWRGVSFTEAELRELATRTGFELRYTEGAGTQYFWLWMFKPSSPERPEPRGLCPSSRSR